MSDERDEHQDDDDLTPLEKLRRRRRADDEARRQAWLAEHAGDPDDPFTEADMERIAATVSERIYHLSRHGGDESWLKLTYIPSPPFKLIEITMGSQGDDEPTASLIISDTEAHDLIARITGAIGPQDPAPRRVTDWSTPPPDDRDDEDGEDGDDEA